MIQHVPISTSYFNSLFISYYSNNTVLFTNIFHIIIYKECLSNCYRVLLEFHFFWHESLFSVQAFGFRLLLLLQTMVCLNSLSPYDQNSVFNSHFTNACYMPHQFQPRFNYPNKIRRTIQISQFHNLCFSNPLHFISFISNFSPQYLFLHTN